jgi:hypothetical protein
MTMNGGRWDMGKILRERRGIGSLSVSHEAFEVTRPNHDADGMLHNLVLGRNHASD